MLASERNQIKLKKVYAVARKSSMNNTGFPFENSVTTSQLGLALLADNAQRFTKAVINRRENNVQCFLGSVTNRLVYEVQSRSFLQAMLYNSTTKRLAAMELSGLFKVLSVTVHTELQPPYRHFSGRLCRAGPKYGEGGGGGPNCSRGTSAGHRRREAFS